METIYNRDDFRLELEFTRIYIENAGKRRTAGQGFGEHTRNGCFWLFLQMTGRGKRQ